MQYSLFNNSNPSSKENNKHTENQPMSLIRKVQGFTLIELMVTIAVLGIIITIAIPGLGSFTAKMRVDNRVTELQRLLLNTRNAAINSGVLATLCRLPDDPTEDADCQNNNDWTGRIGIITVDGLIKEREALPAGDRLDFIIDRVVFNPSGQLANNNVGTFNYCPKNFIDFSRGVTLSLAGRAYLSTDLNGDGLDQDRNANTIQCI